MNALSLAFRSQPPRPSSEGRGGSACTGKDRRVTQPPSPPRRPRPVAGTTARAAGARRARTGGRVAGTAYAPASPAEAGGGARFPYRDYTAVEPRVVHRDLKPENVLLIDGAWRVADFGISRYAGAATA